MQESKLELSRGCGFVLTEWGEDLPSEVELVYTEHSPDPWYSDAETSIEIDREEAVAIIEFLQNAFGIEG